MRIALSLVLLSACADPDPDAARRAWLVERLTDDNAVWAARDPALLAGKYAVMAADPYDFLRGTAAVFLADLARPDPDRAPTAFLQVPEAGQVLVLGDPHLENLGAALAGPEPDTADADPDATLTLEWNDLDAVAYGPWSIDTRRAALALALVAGDDPPGAVEAFARAYAAEIREPGAALDEGPLVADLRDQAHHDGLAQSELADLTTVATGPRRIVRTPVDPDGDGMIDLGAAEELQLGRLLAAWPAKPPGFRVLDQARWFGKGVASRPATRYLVAWDLGDDRPTDDRLLNLREVVDPPRQPLAPGASAATLPPGADRIGAATALWSTRDVDVLYAGVADGLQVFKTSAVSGWSPSFDHGDLIGALLVSDQGLDGLGATVGRALAAAHARATAASGDLGGDLIARDLDRSGGEEALVDERLRDAPADLARLVDDHRLFLQALDQLGPWLGADQVVPR